VDQLSGWRGGRGCALVALRLDRAAKTDLYVSQRDIDPESRR
jgi:hypothetical protein